MHLWLNSQLVSSYWSHRDRRLSCFASVQLWVSLFLVLFLTTSVMSLKWLVVFCLLVAVMILVTVGVVESSFTSLRSIGSWTLNTAWQMTIKINRCLMSDIDECELNHCEQRCTNLFRSYTCSCYDGYQLENDTKCVGGG